VLPAGATATTVRFDQLTGFLDEDPDAEFRGGAAEPASASDKPQPDDGPMIVETSDSDTEDDMHSTNTVGNVPAHWYDDETHVGYDLDGKKIGKSGREKDRLDKFLQKIDDPDYGRTIVDPLTKKEIVLTDEEVDMIKRIQVSPFSSIPSPLHPTALPSPPPPPFPPHSAISPSPCSLALKSHPLLHYC
jgi:hypothetical protein